MTVDRASGVVRVESGIEKLATRGACEGARLARRPSGDIVFQCTDGDGRPVSDVWRATVSGEIAVFPLPREALILDAAPRGGCAPRAHRDEKKAAILVSALDIDKERLLGRRAQTLWSIETPDLGGSSTVYAGAGHVLAPRHVQALAAIRVLSNRPFIGAEWAISRGAACGGLTPWSGLVLRRRPPPPYPRRRRTSSDHGSVTTTSSKLEMASLSRRPGPSGGGVGRAVVAAASARSRPPACPGLASASGVLRSAQWARLLECHPQSGLAATRSAGRAPTSRTLRASAAGVNALLKRSASSSAMPWRSRTRAVWPDVKRTLMGRMARTRRASSQPFIPDRTTSTINRSIDSPAAPSPHASASSPDDASCTPVAVVLEDRADPRRAPARRPRRPGRSRSRHGTSTRLGAGAAARTGVVASSAMRGKYSATAVRVDRPAVHRDAPAALRGEPARGRQAEARPASGRLGRERPFEDPLAHFDAHPDARVGDREAPRAPGPAHAVHVRLVLAEHDVRGAQGEARPPRGIASRAFAARFKTTRSSASRSTITSPGEPALWISTAVIPGPARRVARFCRSLSAAPTFTRSGRDGSRRREA